MTIPVTFLGLANHFESKGNPYPYGPIDLFGLSKYKNYPVYPWTIKGCLWVFLVQTSIIKDLVSNPFSISIEAKGGAQVAYIEFSPVNTEQERDASIIENDPSLVSAESLNDEWQLVMTDFDLTVPEPGICLLIASHKGEKSQIGQINFIYHKAKPFQAEDIKAIEADPNSAKSIRMVIQCKECTFKFIAYSSLDRSEKLEEEGHTWQHDLPDLITCSCGKTHYDLRYLKESMHAMLGDSRLTEKGEINYIRRYSHDHILNIVTKYSEILRTKKDEGSLQSYLEENPVLLSQFHAKRIFTKPRLIGKYEADFAILDVSKKLIFIEIERPSIKLFKKDGHPTADLMHAYGQVRDWLNLYKKNTNVILDSMNLSGNDVLRVCGIVVAGIARKENEKHLQRHMMEPIYNDVEFFTFDQLGTSLTQLSRELV